MTDSDSRRAAALAQAEDLYFEAERTRLEALDAQAERQRRLQAQHRHRIQFLKSNDATPLDIADYERWLADYVAANGQLRHYLPGAYPRPLDQQPTPLLQQLVRELDVEVGSLEHDYFSSNVIWTVATPLTLDALPALEPGLHLSLHLTRRALELFDTAALFALDPSQSGLHLYLDGRWRAGQWHPVAHEWNVQVGVWAENLTNLRGEPAAQENR